MRHPWVTGLVFVVGATSAYADKKTQGLTPGYRKEAKSCVSQHNGLVRITTGATTLAEAADGDEKAALEADVAKLKKVVAVFDDYCKQTQALVDFLDENAKTPYKTVEREIDSRDNSIRKLRKETKKLIVEVEPITRKLIPKMAQRPTAPPEEKRVLNKFPSGHSVELPATLPGTWRLSGNATTDTAIYTDKDITATVSVRQLANARCDVEKKAMTSKADVAGVTDLDFSANPNAKDLGIEWALRYTRKEKSTSHRVIAACVARKSTGFLATANIEPEAATIADEITKLVIRMLAAQPRT